MRAIWKGSISFGLVSIPIALFPATKSEELKFRLLRGKDLSPVNYKRVAQSDGKEVPWEEIVKGYEYEKGKFVVLKDEDFKRVDIEATQTVDILSFVSVEEVNPLLFYKPYYMEPQKGGDRAYVLLREALEETGKIGISKVVIKTRQHLAAVKPQEEGLMLELMHFPSELRDVSEFKAPREARVAPNELKMAVTLIGSMTTAWDPDAYKDDYKEAVEEMIEQKMARGEEEAPKATPRRATSKVIDLVAVLEESLRAGKKSPSPKREPSREPAKKKPAKRATQSAAATRKSSRSAAKSATPARKRA